MDDNLRIRFERLLESKAHPTRAVELETFSRLLYRNRNQHRHGLYFRRLEQVRRISKKCEEHVSWNSIQHSLGPNDNAVPRKRLPLSISSVTLSDLKALEQMYDQLISDAIPNAALKVTSELICREHFLPFGMSVMAGLARLFVMERKILSELRGAVLEVKVMFGGDQDLNEEPSHASLEIAEDIGISVPTTDDVQLSEKKRKYHDPSLATDNKTRDQVPFSAVVKSCTQQQTSTTEPNKDNGPSLYDLVEKHSRNVPLNTEFKIRTSVSMTDEGTLASTPGGGDQGNLATKERSPPMKRSRIASDEAPSVLATIDIDSALGKREKAPIDDRSRLGSHSQEASAPDMGSPSDQSCASDDMDDIFADIDT